MLYRSYRYSQWDGTQQIFDVDAGDLMDQLSDELLKQGDVMQALRELFRKGMQNREGMQLTGLRDLMERLKNQRRQQLEQHNMDSVVGDLKERLEQILRTEREGIDRRLAQAQEQMDQSSPDHSSDEEREQQEGLYRMLEQRAQRGGGQALAEGRNDTAGDENITRHRPPSISRHAGTITPEGGRNRRTDSPIGARTGS